MANAFVRAPNGAFVNPGTSLTVALDCTSATKLIVGTVGDAGTDSIAGVTYAGVAMTKIASAASPTNRFATMWMLDSPASGTNNIVATPSGSSYIEITAACYSGMASGAPEAQTSNTTSSATGITGTVTVATANAWTVAVCCHQSGGITAGAGTTLRGTSGLVGATVDSNGPLSAGAQSLIINGAGANAAAIVIASFAPAGGPPPSAIASISSYYRMIGAA